MFLLFNDPNDPNLDASAAKCHVFVESRGSVARVCVDYIAEDPVLDVGQCQISLPNN